MLAVSSRSSVEPPPDRQPSQLDEHLLQPPLYQHPPQRFQSCQVVADSLAYLFRSIHRFGRLLGELGNSLHALGDNLAGFHSSLHRTKNTGNYSRHSSGH